MGGIHGKGVVIAHDPCGVHGFIIELSDGDRLSNTEEPVTKVNRGGETIPRDFHHRVFRIDWRDKKGKGTTTDPADQHLEVDPIGREVNLDGTCTGPSDDLCLPGTPHLTPVRINQLDGRSCIFQIPIGSIVITNVWIIGGIQDKGGGVTHISNYIHSFNVPSPPGLVGVLQVPIRLIVITDMWIAAGI